LLDTNVVSEALRPHHNTSANVRTWLQFHGESRFFLSRISETEIKAGAYGHPDPVQGRRLIESWNALSKRLTLLEFTHMASDSAARFSAKRNLAGRPVSFADAAIAGIALANNCALATRNTKDFEGSDLTLINPFDPSGE